MKPWLWGLAALLLFALALIVMAPASLALALLPESLPLAFEDVRGSVWNGSAQRLWVHQQPFGSLAWQVHPLALLSGRLECDVQVRGDLTGSASLERSGSRWRLRALHAELPARLLTPILASPGLQAQGRLRLHLPSLELHGGYLTELRGELTWPDAAVSGAASAALGSLRAEFSAGGDGRVHGRLSDDGGPLALGGEFIVDVVDAVGYQATIDLRARDPRIAPALRWLGQAQADGSRRLLLQGSLR